MELYVDRSHQSRAVQLVASFCRGMKSFEPYQVFFRWPYEGVSVQLAGSFSSWKPAFEMLRNPEGVFELSIPLSPGRHQYKFVVDGRWCYDVRQPTAEDEKGNINNEMNIADTGPLPVLVEGDRKIAGVEDVALELAGGRNESFVGQTVEKKAELKRWLQFFGQLCSSTTARDTAEVSKLLFQLNKSLLSSTFVVDPDLSYMDIVLYSIVHTIMQLWDERFSAKFTNIARWFDNIQHLSMSSPETREAPVSSNWNFLPKVPILSDPYGLPPKILSKAEGEVEKGKKRIQPENAKQKKSKQGSSAGILGMSRLLLKVGQIRTCRRHENAESLYVEEIDVGEDTPRIVVSGLAKLIPLEQLQNRLCVVLCNMKPMNMRGVKSAAMLLVVKPITPQVDGKEETPAQSITAELLEPPKDAKIGERVIAQGQPDDAPDGELNPKHKIWEKLQPDFGTNEDCVATFRGSTLLTSAGTVRCQSIRNGRIS